MFIIELWLAAILFVFAAMGLIAIAVLARRKAKRKWMIAGIISLSVILLALLAYILLTFVFLDAISSQPPDDLLETSVTTETTQTNDEGASADTSAIPVFYPFELYDVIGLNEEQKKLYDEIYPKDMLSFINIFARGRDYGAMS